MASFRKNKMNEEILSKKHSFLNKDIVEINIDERNIIRSNNDIIIGKSSGINEKANDADDDKPPYPKKRWSRVLIVDDVPMNRKMLKRLFATRFDECEEAGDGQIAVDMVKEAMARGKTYDIIAMDYQMPFMDGVSATSYLRRLGYRGHIIAVTGNALSEDVNSFLSSGADIVLTKPLSIASFDNYMASIS